MTEMRVEEVAYYDNEDWRIDKATVVHTVIERARIDREIKEDYEKCAELRDLAKVMSNYVLGYRKFDVEILEIMYYTARYFGSFVSINEFEEEGEVNYEVLYLLDGHHFYFNVDLDEAIEIKKEEEKW